MEQKFDNAMRRQVYSIPELITQQYDLMEPRIREALSFRKSSLSSISSSLDAATRWLRQWPSSRHLSS